MLRAVALRARKMKNVMSWLIRPRKLSRPYSFTTTRFRLAFPKRPINCTLLSRLLFRRGNGGVPLWREPIIPAGVGPAPQISEPPFWRLDLGGHAAQLLAHPLGADAMAITHA